MADRTAKRGLAVVLLTSLHMHSQPRRDFVNRIGGNRNAEV